ncbi:hypothetical protein [Streptomyces sp. NPDC053367]|uniref:hypothetical protein n=1 Tax=Streptomyces sp. NPDC053367 TaxID=3365700 RepID=UPI0037D0C89D
MFERGARDDPVVEPVHWDRAGWFAVTDLVRPASLRRKARKEQWAVRAGTMRDGAWLLAPMAFITVSGGDAPVYHLYDATHPETSLCSATPERNGARYRVTDGQDRELGVLHRTPAAKRTVQHDWWFRLPDHADIVASYHWTRVTAKEVAARGKQRVAHEASELVGSVVQSFVSLGIDGGGDERGRIHVPKPVAWRAEGEPEPMVLTSGQVEGIRAYRPLAGWLDLRLAYTLAVVREAAKGPR